MRKIAENERLEPEYVREEVASGRMVILYSRKANAEPVAVGGGTRTKVNANIGTSADSADIELELEKLRVAIHTGADTVMDLSTGGDLDEIRRAIIAESTVPVGYVPIYQTIKETVEKGLNYYEFDPDKLFEDIEKQAVDGVAFATVHCGVTKNSLKYLREQGRVLGIVSRGGAFIARYIEETGKENPLYEQFGRLLDIALKYDLILSLGDGLRPGCIADATDRAQVEELLILGELRKRALEAGVQVMIEGPGHIPLHQIEENIRLQKSVCEGAPFYVLGPLVTDIAPGFDHITGAIGGALAAFFGADFLCYVTPSEHIRLPDVTDVAEGVIASRIAAHAADIAKGIKSAVDVDYRISEARANLDWETQKKLALLPSKFEQLRSSSHPKDKRFCTMCGEFCAIRIFHKK